MRENKMGRNNWRKRNRRGENGQEILEFTLVTKPGIDKGYGIRKLRDLLGISLQEMIFVGDALFVGGNDHPAAEAGVVCISVRGPEETKLVINTIVACLDGDEEDASSVENS